LWSDFLTELFANIAIRLQQARLPRIARRAILMQKSENEG
jgi:hypothetical protein